MNTVSSELEVEKEGTLIGTQTTQNRALCHVQVKLNSALKNLSKHSIFAPLQS